MWINVKGRIPVAMTIAGSDSGGGAGIEADLKTFAALGVHGTVVLTSITAQNTVAVTGVQDVKLDIIEKQIDAVVEDIGVDAAKTGMLHTSEIIEVVAKKVKEHKFPLVVDPVMIAKSGAPLLKPEAVKTLVEVLIPLAEVVTPNVHEAEVLAGIHIKDLESQKEAAKRIAELGPKAVVVKGGHVEGGYSIDVLFHNDNYYFFRAPRIPTKTTHGTGCGFSAAIAAELAKGFDVVQAVGNAKRFITLAIRYGIPIGKGHGPINPLAILYKESERYNVWKEVWDAVNIIERSKQVYKLVPEVGMNIAAAVPYADTVEDVVGIPGRIRKAGNRAVAACPPEYGGSSHLARYILSMLNYDYSKRAAINVKFEERFLDLLKAKGFKISYYDRRLEPAEIKEREGATIPWGVEQAIKNLGEVPDVIYHKGDWGKEPMIVIFGKNARYLAKLVVELAEEMVDEETIS